MTYASYTRGTTEPLKRLAHGRRFQQVLGLIAKPLTTDVVLDYGCGDGHLFSSLVDRFSRVNLVGYDPNPLLLAEASAEVREGCYLTGEIEALKVERPRAFSLIYCMEVCEHLTDKALDELLKNIALLAAPHARIIIGVPIETGLSGFLKSIYRTAHGGRQSAGIAQAFRTLFNMKIERKVTDVEWHGAHTGFSHTRLREILEHRGFRIIRTFHLPFPALRSILNNEIYFVCE
jgi:2-polyprenyl-3-methyl-5-hydroxy-6-metoxy-1,4-benzoquinol methylase